MQIAILTQGSRGDVQPYVALGVGLQRAGHQVRLVGPGAFAALVTASGLEFVALTSFSPQTFIRSPEIQAAARRGAPLRMLATLLRSAGPLLEGMFEEFWRTSAGVDLIVANTLPLGIVDCARARGVPCVHAPLHGFQPTRAFPNPFFAPFGPTLHAALNPLTHHLVRFVVWQLFRGALNRWRRKHGWRPILFKGYFHWMNEHRLPTVYGFSPLVLPEPDDWPPWHHVTGYWFWDEPHWQPPAELVRFLEAGPPPVYVGFGSMDDQDPERITQVVLDALQRCGQRGILVAGWGGLGNTPLPDYVLRLPSVPHSWLFPLVAGVVYHGGAGSTAAGLRAGVPTVVLPLAGDQPFWAQRLVQLGVGVRGQPFFRATAEGLAAAITHVVNDTAMRRRAADLGAVIQAEDGVSKAVQVIAQCLS